MKRILKLFFVFLFLIIFSNIFKEKVFALTTDPSKLGIVTNGTIYDIVTDGNQAYISGIFSKVGPSIGAMGLFNLNTFSLTRPDKVYGDINVIISDGSDG